MNIEAWVIIAALVQAILAVVIILLIKGEEKQHRSTR